MPKSQQSPLSGYGLERLREGASKVGIKLTQAQGNLFSCYLSLLLDWNAKFNLTSIKDPSLIIRLHFIDSMAVVPFLQPTGELLDIGSGAGFPGIPVKIVLPRKEVVLLEARRKKANFLREAIRTLGIKGIKILQERAENLDPERTGAFGEVMTRAFGPVDRILKISRPILTRGGRCLIMHGPKGAELFHSMEKRIADLGFIDGRLERYSLPYGKEKRTLLIYVRR